jgi:uncharacterized protein
LHLVTAATLSVLFSKYSAADFKVGKLSAFESVDVFIDPDTFFGRHAAILGQSGSGKSWSVTSFIQSALKAMPNAHVIILDLHGEYGSKDWDPSTSPPFPADKVRCIKAADLEIPYWLLTYEELIELLIDPDDPNASVQIAFLRGSVLELKREANGHLNLGHITVDSPIYFSLEASVGTFQVRQRNHGGLRQDENGPDRQIRPVAGQAAKPAQRHAIRLPAAPEETHFIGDFARPAARLRGPGRAARQGHGAGPEFGAVRRAPDGDRPDRPARLRIQLLESQVPRIPAFRGRRGSAFLHPRATASGHQGTRRSFERIAKAGRKYAVGLCVVSQRPNELSETVLSQCSTFVCLRITNPDDQEYVRALVPDSARGILEALTSLAPGEAIAAGEGVPMPVRFRVTRPDPPPNAQDIEYANMWARGPQDTDVEHIVDCWRRQRR